jgi:S-DNA-T family DNA segregation ATPase FtsK/SpoIIIE
MSVHENSLSVQGYSPNYAPLEQIQGGKTSSQSDLYSLAATLYHLLTNQKPADALSRAAALVYGDADPLIHISDINPELPGNVAGILMQALSLQPTRRPLSAVVMRAALNDLQEAALYPIQNATHRPPAQPVNYDIQDNWPRSFRNDSSQQVEPLMHKSPIADAYPETFTKYSSSASRSMGDYELPSFDLLNALEPKELSDEEFYAQAAILAEMFSALKVKGKILHINPGPVLTTYEFRPDPGVKYSRVKGLSDDICLAMRAPYVNIEIVPGTSNIGIQIPNPHREIIHLRQIIESKPFRESASKLSIAFGVTVNGLNYFADLSKLPHLLIAGATGSGKSVFLNSLIISILYKARPAEVQFILVDPKRVELGLYEGIPHLKTPIITDPKRAALALMWAVAEMEKRFKEFAGWGVRNIDGFNAEVQRRNLVKDYDQVTNEPWKPLPYIIIVIDELADLMMSCPDEIEESLTALARKERAVGIHLVLATQRPSAEVITGPIKANFTARVSFHVASKADSRIIIDTNGAEDLLGLGDMLFMRPKEEMVRIHGAYIDEAEISRVVSHIKAQVEPLYDVTITQTEEALGFYGSGGERDELFEDALRICVEMKRASTSILQRQLRIGYGRAAEILNMMEREGFIGQADGARPRPVLSRAFETVADWDE